jgi:hypothetical protein
VGNLETVRFANGSVVEPVGGLAHILVRVVDRVENAVGTARVSGLPEGTRSVESGDLSELSPVRSGRSEKALARLKQRGIV